MVGKLYFIYIFLHLKIIINVIINIKDINYDFIFTISKDIIKKNHI